MARKRIKRKRMTVTEMYNRYAVGLQYYGESLATKKRATHKQLKEIKKHTANLRKQLKEQGIENPPTIAQAYKLIKEQETAKLKQMLDKHFAEDLEPLDYAQESLDLSSFEYPIIEEFQSLLYNILSNAEERFNYRTSYNNPYIVISQQVSIIEEKIAQILANNELKSAFADYLAKSDEFEQLHTYYENSYEEIEEALDAINSNIEALINDFSAKQKSPTFIAPTTIHFDV